MAVPRKRKSHSRRRQQRSHHALGRPNTGKCANCEAPKIPHNVCAACGYHNGRAVVEVESE
jgi:large subunit ribosomal protein L32